MEQRLVMEKESKIPTREEVSQADKWDLSSLYKSQEEWDSDLKEFVDSIKKITVFKGKLSNKTESNEIVGNKESLKECLDVYSQALQRADSLGNYAFLLQAGDQGSSKYCEIYSRFMMAATEFESQTSFLLPEIQTLSTEFLQSIIAEPKFFDYSVYLEKLLHVREHILSEKEEKVLALQNEAESAVQNTFSQLTNVDMNFGTIKTEKGELPLSQSTWSVFMKNSNRTIREKAYQQFYKVFDSHKNTLASLYIGSVQQDVAHSKIRGYKSSLDAALFSDKIPESVYTNLIQAVHEGFDDLHEYYSLLKKSLAVDELRHYDVYMPFAPEAEKATTFSQAVELLEQALAPLGKEYTDTLCYGLTHGWVDKYENVGKRSGAFSSGGYKGYPYILLNYKDDSIRDLFTMAHEGGHSMHSYYSAKNNPFMHYNYTIFEAEVASTVNEELVFQYLLKNLSSAQEKKSLLSTRLGDIVATLHRQTMFAEFELIAHQRLEQGIPLTLDLLREEYGKLLTSYFGPEMVFEKESNLECLRIPHFYRAFYVYKYSTGISAALALASRLLNEGEKAQKDYFTFLKSGGSRYPLESLKIAGVDLQSKETVKTALARFKQLLQELSQL